MRHKVAGSSVRRRFGRHTSSHAVTLVPDGVEDVIRSISAREFDIYALSVDSPSVLDEYDFAAGWISRDGSCVGAILRGPDLHDRRGFVLRRQIDARFLVTYDGAISKDPNAAAAEIVSAMRVGDPPEAIKPGAKRRPLLLDLNGRTPGEHFKLLTSTLSHRPALLALGEVYLAMPAPDANFVPDFQTANFDSRLWELYLLAAFREQGVKVAQETASPDFKIERDGDVCHVEAVTANTPSERVQGLTTPEAAPPDLRERLLGAPAARFAKTLRSKLQREYQHLPHVTGEPFALAIADFHAPGSMTWSREALPTYLYGVFAHVEEGPSGRVAVGTPVERLIDEHGIPAGLFRDSSMAWLSAVIFSNAATLAKFNRMGFLAGWRPPGLSMRREGFLFDRTPGALAPVPFDLDILSDEYAALWPHGEAWCVELEVYHNPLATRPMAFGLLPGATHWFELDGDLMCSTKWDHQVLSSMTTLTWSKEPEHS